MTHWDEHHGRLVDSPGFGSSAISYWHPCCCPWVSLVASSLGSFYEAAPRTLNSLHLENKTLVFVTGPDWVSTAWTPVFLRNQNQAIPSRVRTLGATHGSGHRATQGRKDARVVVCHGLLDLPMDRIAWSRSRPFRVGQRVDLSDVSVRVGRVTQDGRPAEGCVSLSRDAGFRRATYGFAGRGDGYEAIQSACDR